MFKKNTAVTGFTFGLVASADGSDITTGAVSGFYSLNGGAQTALTNASAYLANGLWTVNLTAGEMNGNIIGLSFTHASAITVHFTIKTDTKITSDLNDIPATAIVSAGAITTATGKVVEVATLTGHTVQTADHTAGIAAIPTNPALDSVCTEARLAELAAANLPADIDTLIARLTVARTDYLDKLAISGNVASSAEVTAIQNNTRVRVMVPGTMERPDTGSTGFKLDIYIYDTQGNMQAPDSLPTITAVNQAGTSRAANLGAVTLVGTGHYTVTYTIETVHLIEQLKFEWTVIENGATRYHGAAAQVVDTTAVDFTAADRAKLDTMHDVRLTDARAANLDELGAANLPADIDTLIARLTSARAGYLDELGAANLPADIDTLIARLTSARAGYLDELGAANLPADIDTLISRLTALRAGNIDNLDKAISVLKDFDQATQTVDVGKMSGSAVAATNIKDSAERIVTGAAVAGTLLVTEMTTDLTENTNDHYKSCVLIWDDGPLKDLRTDITAYDGTTKKLTFTAVTDVPVAGNKFRLI